MFVVVVVYLWLPGSLLWNLVPSRTHSPLPEQVVKISRADTDPEDPGLFSNPDQGKKYKSGFLDSKKKYAKIIEKSYFSQGIPYFCAELLLKVK